MTFLNWRTKSALKRNKSLRANIPYQQAHTVGILFTVEDKQKHHDIKEFIHQLERDGKKVQVLEYLPKKKENYEFMFDFFTIDDLNFWGTLNSSVANKFATTPFDFLFCVDKESNPLLLYLLSISKAHCRVGRYHELEQDYYEMMIEQNGTIKGLIDTMYKYTKNLK